MDTITSKITARTSLTERQANLYRAARRAGYGVGTALYAVRPAVVELEPADLVDLINRGSGPYVVEAGTFTYRGQTFLYRFHDEAGDCFCYQEAVPAFEEFGRDSDAAGVVTMSGEEAEELEHYSVSVTLSAHDAWQYLGGVCGGGGDPVSDAFYRRHLAETCAELAEQSVAEVEEAARVAANATALTV